MTIEEFAILLLLGKLLMFLARKAPYKNWVPFLRELFDCELCLGVWVYTALSLISHHTLDLGFGYVPFLSEMFTGAISSFIVWIWTQGWNAKFQILYLE